MAGLHHEHVPQKTASAEDEKRKMLEAVLQRAVCARAFPHLDIKQAGWAWTGPTLDTSPSAAFRTYLDEHPNIDMSDTSNEALDKILRESGIVQAH